MIRIFGLALLMTLMSFTAYGSVCNLERFSFGSSLDSVQKSLALSEGMPLFPVAMNESRQAFMVPGEEVCPRDKTFEGAPVIFVFLYDQLVEIQTTRLSEVPTLVTWAEAVYEVKNDKPTSFYDPEPNAEWWWNTEKSVIAYAIETIYGEVRESIIIQSHNQASNFEKFAKEEEELMERARP